MAPVNAGFRDLPPQPFETISAPSLDLKEHWTLERRGFQELPERPALAVKFDN